MGSVSISECILNGDTTTAISLIREGKHINDRDIYGGTALIQAAMCERTDLAIRLLNQGADWTLQDLLGCDPLYWAVDTGNMELVRILCEKGANPNTVNSSRQPALVLPILREQKNLIGLLIKHKASMEFANDYIRVKMMGHLFELTGVGDIVNPENIFVPVKFEGFMPEFTLDMIYDALALFINHQQNQNWRSYDAYVTKILKAFKIASELRSYRHFAMQAQKHRNQIHLLMNNQLLLIPVTYQGHAITFVYYQGLWAKCDRGHRSKPDETAVIFRVSNPSLVTEAFIEKLLYEKNSDHFINQGINEYLGLIPIEKIPTHSQLSGNCSWANVEAAIPVMMFMMGYTKNQGILKTPLFKRNIMNFFDAWHQWNKTRLVDEMIENFKTANRQRKASISSLLACIIFQRTSEKIKGDIERGKKIIKLLTPPPYDVFLRTYIKSYCQEDLGHINKQTRAMLSALGVNLKMFLI